jgi:signal transduction histidine kinase
MIIIIIQVSIEKAYETLKKIYLLNNKTIQKEKEDKILELQEKFETEQKDKLIKQEQAFNQTLQEKNRELAALNEDLAQFNYGVSHDLKEPIRLVRGRLSHMHVKSFHKLEPEEQSSLETSLAAAERMERMLEDLHKFSSLGSNLKNLQQVNLNEVLAIVQADLQERIRSNEALIEVDKLPNLLGYKNMFVQLFQNLINNALKFRRLEVTPHIKISYKADEDWHIIHVQDNGVGIKKENQEQVFKLFKRLQETEAREGSGVGLSIVQKIVKKMQGEISLASVYGTGTCFILKFPKK